jgi:outer membrane protein assembly factor BamB
MTGRAERRQARTRARLRLLGAAAVLLLLAAGTALTLRTVDPPPAAAPDPTVTEPPADATTEPTAEPSPSPSPTPTAAPAPPLGEPAGGPGGLRQFRGNPTRTYYGQGPVPTDPEVAWRYPQRPMCSVEQLSDGTEKEWCGTGWTGQPLVWERDDGVTEVIVGAYDHRIHFVDLATGLATRPPFQTGGMVKGTLTLDPDGYPLLYAGSRDGRFRIIALDREVPTELWSMGEHPQGVWNDDWDSNPSVVDGILYVGGEDSWFRAIALNRTDGPDGVTVEPEVLVEFPGFDQDLIASVGDYNVSIEASVAVTDDRVYVANAGGRVCGLARRALERGRARVVFDHWVGDDVDASPVVGPDGTLYVAVELERRTTRALESGQLIALDPHTDGDPVKWSIDVPARPEIPGDAGGIWATPALYGDTLWVTTHPGDLLGVDTDTGRVVHRDRVGYHEWSSPGVIEDDDGTPMLVAGLCEASGVRAYDVTRRRRPAEAWTVQLGGCVESTPAVWKGSIVVGSRDGYLYALRDG